MSDPAYAMAGLVGVIREFFGPGGLSLGVDLVDRLDCDNWDNGVYQVGADWSIVARWGKGSQNLGADALGATMAPLKGEGLAKYRAIMESLEGLATRGPAGVAA